ncbi:MAG: ABC transporter ATP-binding protein [Anaerovoracaceae bacterium]|jgi:ATP-binding cassette subfamily B multidrug efflux pump
MKYKSRTAERGFRRFPERDARVEKPKNGRKTLKRLILYFHDEMKGIILMLAAAAAEVAAKVIGPDLQSKAIDDIAARNFENFDSLLIWLAVIYGIAGLALLLRGYIGASLSRRVVGRLREDLFDKIVSLPVGYLDSHSHGDIMSRISNDADNIANTISTTLGTFFSGVLTLAGTVVMMAVLNIPLTLIAVSVLAGAVLITAGLTKIMSVYFAKRQELLGELNGIAEEMITNSRTVAAYNLEDEASAEFDEMSDRLTETGVKAEIIGNSMGPIHNMFSNISFVAVAAAGAYFALKGYISIGTIAAFLVYSKQISGPVNMLAQLYGQIETAAAGAERIFALMDVESEDKSGEPAGKTHGAEIEFRHVNFSYVPGREVIHDFNLKIESGKTTALVGATGSGKTTVINLLMRFYDADSGEILFNGKNIKDIAAGDLRRSIGIVLQDTVLFSDTVKANLLYANQDAGPDTVKRAVRAANAERVIANLPDGYDTVLSRGGASLSQGQRQLLAIARAFITDPAVLIFDEATSSVDTRTECSIQDAMAKLMKDRTSLIIAHRLSTIRNADEIIVMDDGRIVERGSHDELMAGKGRYYELYEKQFAGESI